MTKQISILTILLSISLALVLSACKEQPQEIVSTYPIESSADSASEISEEDGVSQDDIEPEMEETDQKNDEGSQGEYTVIYYSDNDRSTTVEDNRAFVSGLNQQLFSLKELGFSEHEGIFEGWRLHRTSDDKWFVNNAKNQGKWAALENGHPPKGYNFFLKKDGDSLKQAAKEGVVELYAQWGGDTFEVYYHLDDKSEEAPLTTRVKYKQKTALLSLDELQFSKEGKKFKGWKIYREVDQKWYLKDKDGKASFKRLQDGKLPEGYSYALRSEDGTLVTAATSGIVHLYGVWK